LVKLKLTLTLTDTGGAVLTLMLGYRSLEKIASRILHTTQILLQQQGNRVANEWNVMKDEMHCCVLGKA